MNIKGLITQVLSATLLVFLLGACASGHCRRDGGEVLQNVDAKPPAGYEEQNLGSIRVSKPDGSLQCEMRAGLPLLDMAQKELKGVEVISAEKRNDGLMRIQACGTETGMINVYEIHHRDLRKAQKSGFTVLKSKR